ncbi:DUF3102 domain-containing protein [Mesorhizobium sp. B2-3-15]|uniref:DUF3102 domain-containing protein n=1 Tax=Mesorhizobium sp. B2-3-15 TaxID=2589949 RepID=UPI0015E3FEEE|nr:DUF3102 domain-containing protein [Mesorhizobium sp. B2-3-15]
MSDEFTTPLASAATTTVGNELQDFNFSTGAAVEIATVKELASETVSDFNLAAVTGRIHKLFDRMKAGAVEIGRAFIVVKSNLPYGEFGKWLDTEFKMTDRTAQNYMNAALAVHENGALAILPDKALYILGAKNTPPEIIEKVVTQIKSGNIPSTRDIEADAMSARKEAAQERLAAAKLAARTKRMAPEDAAKLTLKEEKRAAARKAREDFERAERKRKREEAEQMSENAVVFLMEHLGNRFAEFTELCQAVDSWTFLHALRRATYPSNVVALAAKKDAA